MVAQALHTIGGAAGVRVVQHDPQVGAMSPAIVLAESGRIGDEETSTVIDSDSGLALTITEPEVPPLSVHRALRALATVLTRVEEQEALLLEARTDPLTGLFNRRALDERLEAELARQTRAGGAVSLLMLDVDDFKRINDVHGHAHGDLVLRAVAEAMGNVARTADVLGRIGGDEFSLLLVDTDQDGAAIAAQRLCDRIRRIDGEVTASIGVATAEPEEGRTVTELLQAADEALYAAKRGGRDRVAISTQDTSDARTRRLDR